jgi:hypothetical protein
MKRLKWFVGFIVFGCVVGYLAGHHAMVAGSHGALPVLSPGDVICSTPAAYHAYYDHGGSVAWMPGHSWNGQNTYLQRAAEANGCKYLAPGTMLSSEGNTSNDSIDLGTSDGRFFGADGKEHGEVSLVSYRLETVTAQMPNGSTVKGYGWDNTENSENK